MKFNYKKEIAGSIVEALEYASGIVETVREPLIVLDDKLKVISANKSFYQTFRVKPRETVGRFIYDLGNRQWDIPKLRQLLKNIITKSSVFNNYEIEHDFEEIGTKTMLLNARRIPRLPAKPRILLLAIEDITNLRKAEREEQSSVHKYQSLYFASHDAIMTLEPPSWNFTAGNPATLKIFKAKSEAEFLSYAPWKLSPRFQPDGKSSPDKAKAMINKAMRQGSNFFEWVHKRIDGQEFPADVLLSRVKIEKETFLLATVRDITKQKLAESALKASEERFRTIFDKAQDGIIVVDPGSRKFYLGNKTISRMLGYTTKEISHLTVDDIHPKKDLPRVISAFKRQMKGIIHLAPDLPVRRKNGSVFYADINSTKIEIAGHSYLMGFFHDTTDRRNLEQALESIRNAKEKAIIGAISDGVVACDAKGKIILFNRVMSELTGWSAAEAIGQPHRKVLVFVRENSNRSAEDFMIQAIKRDKTTPLANHLIIIRRDGTRLPIAGGASPIFSESGKVWGCVGVFRDVTRDREIDLAKTEFVSLASHQLRGPLTALNWYGEMLSADVSNFSPDQKNYLKEIVLGSQRMAKLINSLLEVSRLELGTMAIKPENVRLPALTDEIIRQFQPALSAKSLSVNKIYDPALPEIKIDASVYNHVLQNLISNAVKYTSPRGKITVRLSPANHRIVLSVSDTGCGISISDQDDMFVKLFRGHNAIKMDPAGQGLGLYITKKMVDRTGGKIWFTSKENQGSTFFVSWPLRGQASVPSQSGQKRL